MERGVDKRGRGGRCAWKREDVCIVPWGPGESEGEEDREACDAMNRGGRGWGENDARN